MNESNTPKISVVVTTYNRKELLKETIDSIINQTFTDFELIVVDNNSNYNFLSHIKSFNDDRIRPFKNQNNGIIAINRNFGIKQSRGEFIAFCDDDDLWMPNKLQIQLDYLKTESYIGIGSAVTIIGNRKVRLYKNQSNNLFLNTENIFRFRNVPFSSLIVKNTECYFDEHKGLVGIEDLEFQLRLTYKHNKLIILLSKPLIHYRIHENNSTSMIKQLKGHLLLLFSYRHKISTSTLQYSSAKIYFRLCLLMMNIPNNNSYKKYIKKSLNNSVNGTMLYFQVLAVLVLLSISERITRALYQSYCYLITTINNVSS